MVRVLALSSSKVTLQGKDSRVPGFPFVELPVGCVLPTWGKAELVVHRTACGGIANYAVLFSTRNSEIRVGN